jgi:hypothetical protein
VRDAFQIASPTESQSWTATAIVSGTMIRLMGWKARHQRCNWCGRQGGNAASTFDIEMNKLYDALRRNGFATEERSTGNWMAHQRAAVEIELWNNSDSLHLRLGAIVEARRVARDMLPLRADVTLVAIGKSAR